MLYRYISKKEQMFRERVCSPREAITQNMTIKDIERFCKKISRSDNCWNFESRATKGWLRFDGNLAHRVSFELFVGKIPKGLTIDHLCRNKRCVKPSHLEPVTAYVNSKRWADYQRYGVEAVPEYAI